MSIYDNKCNLYIESDIELYIFYKKLLKSLNLKIQKLSTVKVDNLLNLKPYNSKQILFFYDSLSILDILNEKDIDYILFNPLNNEKESYSMLVLEDGINIKLSDYIYKIICSEFNYNEITVHKWENIYKIITATKLSRTLIDYSFTFNNKNTADVKIEYPLFNMLKNTKDNIVGITLEKSEIDLLIEIYQSFIIDVIDDIFKESITIPAQNNKYHYFYTLIKFYLNTAEQIFNKYKLLKSNLYISHLKKDINSIENDINNLNKFTPYDFSDKLDKELYIQEIKTRKESEPDWLLLKGNEMGKSKKQSAVVEDNKMGKSKKELAVVEDNNIGKIIDNFGNFLGTYNIKQYNNAINKFNTEMLVREQKDNYQIWKNDQEWKDIFYLQNLVLNVLKTNGGALWYDRRINKYCFRSKLNGSISKVNSEELGDLLTRAFKERIIHFYNNNNLLDYAMEVVVVSKLKDINNRKLNINERSNDIIRILLFENEIKTVDDDVFDITRNQELFKNDNDSFYTKNRFIPTEYLKKRYMQRQPSIEPTFTAKFIYYLAKENQELSDYIVNWLGYYFQNLQKSKTALVLLGDQEVTQDIFWNILIKEVFGQRYCTTINDEEQKTALVSDIAKDKLFFHIGDIDNANIKFNNATLAPIIKDLLIKPLVITNTNEEINIHGQIIITATNPAPYLKKVLSKCTVIEVSDMETIVEKLDIEDEGELEDMVREDLDNFTNYLLNYDVDENKATNRIDTEARQILKESQATSNINKDDIDIQIDTFIQAIKDKDIDYFDKVKGTRDKKDDDIYEQLICAFNQDNGYFIGQDLYLYYNAIYEQPFKINRLLMNRLKDKDAMFMQEVKTLKIQTSDNEKIALFQAPRTTKETGTKELYKINNYTMAKDIIIPTGAIQLSSQENINKYSFENEQDISIWNEKIKEKKDKNKAK